MCGMDFFADLRVTASSRMAADKVLTLADKVLILALAAAAAEGAATR